MSHTRLHNIWLSMRGRCEKPKCSGYKKYGAKGIRVCAEWNCFDNFMNWAYENGYTDELTIDRIDPKGNYEPSNCRWATTKEQNRNYSKNIFVEFNNTKICLKELSEIIKINYGTLLWRYKNNKEKFIKGVEKYGKIRCF